MIFNLDIRQASAATSAEDESNTILTVMIASLRRSEGGARDHDLEQYESVAHTRLHLHVVEWLRDRNVQYEVGVMRITIPDPDQAMEFKMRWL